MGLRAQYEDQYVIEKQLAGSSSIATLLGTLADFAAGGQGIDDDTMVLLLNNHPDINPNPTTVHKRKTTGKSYRKVGVGNEYHVGVLNPNSSWEFDANATTLALPLWLLFQSGIEQEQSVANFAKRIVPYGSDGTVSEPSAMEVYASIGRNLDAESQVMDACIINNLTLSAEEGQALKASVGFLGAAYRKDVNASSWNTTYTLRQPLLWQNAAITLRYNATAGVKLDLTDFNLSFNNNAKIRHYNNQNVSKFVLGNLDVTGSIKITRDITNYASNSVIDDWLDTTNNLGVDRTILIMWDSIQSGGGSTTNDIGITAGDTVLNVAGTGSFTVGDIIIIDDGGTEQEFGLITAISAGVSLTVADPVVFSHTSDAIVEAGRDFFGIRMNVRYDGAPTTGEDELVNDVSFTTADNDTDPSIMMCLADNVDRVIP